MRHRIVITRHRPWARALLIGGGSFVLALAGWGLYSYTRASTVSEFERARLEVDQLREERRTLTRELRTAREEIRDLKGQATYVQRSKDIDAQACDSVRESLTTLQNEAAQLREQVAFYRGIVSPEQARAGVRVYQFSLSPEQAERTFRYDLLLIQSVRHDKRVSGRVELTLVASRDGKTVNLPWADLVTDEDGRNLLFSMKYFEEISGDIAVPPSVKPLRVVVSLVPDGGGKPKVEETFDWSRVLGQAGE